MYQVRGQDISNITFVEGEKGIIVIDPLVTPPAAKAALDLYFQHRPQKTDCCRYLHSQPHRPLWWRERHYL